MSLNSRQRVLMAVRRQQTGCVAAGPYMYDVAAVVAGIPLQDYYTDPEAMARAQLLLHERVGQDIISVGADNFYIAEGFGCETTRTEDELPSLIKPAASSLAAVQDLEVPDPRRDGRMPVMLEAIRAVRRVVGAEVAVRSPGTGPFALASYLVGTQNWLMEIAMVEAGMLEANEEGVHHALDLASQALIRFGKACWDAGADIIHCGDSLASCDVISPRTYRRFALPYQQRVFRAWREHGVGLSLLHICGNSTRVLDLYADSGADVIEIDNKVDLALAKQRIGARVALMGNVNTVTELLDATPEVTGRAAQRCIDVAGQGGGFVLGSGCLVPRHTPIANLRQMVGVAHSQAYARSVERRDET